MLILGCSQREPCHCHWHSHPLTLTPTHPRAGATTAPEVLPQQRPSKRAHEADASPAGARPERARSRSRDPPPRRSASDRHLGNSSDRPERSSSGRVDQRPASGTHAALDRRHRSAPQPHRSPRRSSPHHHHGSPRHHSSPHAAHSWPHRQRHASTDGSGDLRGREGRRPSDRDRGYRCELFSHLSVRQMSGRRTGGTETTQEGDSSRHAMLQL